MEYDVIVLLATINHNLKKMNHFLWIRSIWLSYILSLHIHFTVILLQTFTAPWNESFTLKGRLLELPVRSCYPLDKLTESRTNSEGFGSFRVSFLNYSSCSRAVHEVDWTRAVTCFQSSLPLAPLDNPLPRTPSSSSLSPLQQGPSLYCTLCVSRTGVVLWSDRLPESDLPPRERAWLSLRHFST